MLRRTAETDRLIVVLRRLDNDDIRLMAGAAFAVAVRRHFPPGTELREATAVVTEIRKAMTGQLDLMKMEFLIRSAMGEDLPIDDITPNEQLMSRMLILAGLADLWNRDEAAVNDVILEAEDDLNRGHQLVVSET